MVKDGENGQPGLNGETVIPKFKVSSDNYVAGKY